MRSPFIGLSSLLLAACGSARATAPDSSNAVHCFAAFNYAAYWFKVGREPERESVMLGRSLYELNRAKQAGIVDPLAEAKDFLGANGNNHKDMGGLFQECSSAQNADPDFRAQLPDLVSRAKAEVLPKF
jgi:hypothetical protein